MTLTIEIPLQSWVYKLYSYSQILYNHIQPHSFAHAVCWKWKVWIHHITIQQQDGGRSYCFFYMLYLAYCWASRIWCQTFLMGYLTYPRLSYSSTAYFLYTILPVLLSRNAPTQETWRGQPQRTTTISTWLQRWERGWQLPASTYRAGRTQGTSWLNSWFNTQTMGMCGGCTWGQMEKTR